MQIATSPPSAFRLPCSLSEPSSFDVLCLPLNSPNMSPFNVNSLRSTAMMTTRRLSAVPNPCVDIIRLADSPSISPDSTRIKAVSSPRRFQEYEVPGTLRSAPKIIGSGHKRRRPIFSVLSDEEEDLSFVKDLAKIIDTEDVFGGAQASTCVPSSQDIGHFESQSSPQADTSKNLPEDRSKPPLHGLKPWHALTEIVSTELTYVHDLRKLSHVYFPALLALPLAPSTATAVQRLSNNVSELLKFHESFLKSLQSVKKRNLSAENLDDAIERIAQVFISKASQFDLYKFFCSYQPEVHALLGVERGRLKMEWKLFEQQCTERPEIHASCSSPASLDATDGTSCSDTGHLTPASASAGSRSASPPSAPQTRISSSGTFEFIKASVSSRGLSETRGSTTSSGIQRSLSVDSVILARRRLRFQDFLIQPIQRLCRYPILIRSLRQSKTHSEHIDAALAQALQSMHAATARVDEAQRVWEETRKSKLITDRLETHNIVSDEFLRSLGSCILAGALDVAYHHHVYNPIDPPIRVRYMAAFLFPGGYLILAKVYKHQSYRIKHWFDAASFEMVDIPEEEALVPHAFRLSRADHHFEIAAACVSEKELWIQTIRKAARSQNNAWTSEPPSSVETREHIPSAASSFNLQTESSGQFSPSKGFSPINDDQQRSHTANRSSLRIRTAVVGGATRLFSISDGAPLLLKRSTAAERDLVDREMKDVQTVSLADCRLQAQTRSEIMFPPPKFTQPVQAMAMATTGKLVRRGSLLWNRSRNPSSFTMDQEDPGIVVSPTRRINRVGPSIAPSLSALHSEPECIDVVEKTPLSNNENDPFITGSETMQDLASDGAVLNDSPKTPTHRKNSFAANLKGLVRKATSKRNSVQLSDDKLDLMATDASQSRRRVSSAPPSPPQTNRQHETKDLNTIATNDNSLDACHSLPYTPSASSLKPRSSLKKLIFRH